MNRDNEMSMNGNLPLVSIITVNYNGTQLTRELLLSLQKTSYPNIEIIVVDNGSKTPPHELKSEFEEIQLIISDKNLGFAGGNNLGFQKAKGKYYLMLNNDTEVASDFLEPLVNTIEKDNTIGCVSSKLIYYYKENTLQYAGNDGMNMMTGRAFSRGWGEKDEGQYDDIKPIALAHGAAMMLRKQTVIDIGLMADLYFLYYEEVDYCKRILDGGYQIYYVGTSKVFHKESMTVGKESPIKAYYMARNRALYIRRNARGIEKFISFLYFHFIAVPKAIISYLMKGDLKLLKAYIKGVSWNFNHFDIYKHPTLLNTK